jgi:hypothetical protein
LHGTGLSIADVDAGGSKVQDTVSVVSGTLTAAAGTTGVTVSGSGTTGLTLTGTLTQINNLLAGNLSGTLTYINGSNTPPASDTLTLQVSDLGNTGTGGTLTGSDTAIINLTAVNDAPFNTVPAAQAVNEDGMLTFSSGTGNAISIADVDAGAGTMQVTLSASNGVINLAGLTGLAFSTGDGTADPTMTFTGTIADINAALDGMTFKPTTGFNGAATLQIVTNDQGNTGSGGVQTDTDAVVINVSAVNDGPANTVPGPQFINEDTTLVFSAAGGNAISIGDPDASSNPVQVTLTAANGALTLAGASGLTFTTGDGTADATMTFTGTISDINAALDGLSFTPTLNFNGAASLQIVTDDQGNTGSGGALTDSDTVSITVSAINDAPINNVPPAQAMNEDSTLVFSAGNSNQISISDVDAGSNPVQVTLTAGNGLISLAGFTGLTFSSGDGSGDATMTFSGSRVDINAALNGLTFTSTPEFNGAASLQIFTNDQGHTGAGGPLSDNDTIAITVNAVNDAPINSVPSAQSTNEDTPLVFSAANGNPISISDLDAAAGQVTLTGSNGVVTLAGIGGLTFTTGDGTADATMTFTGTVANINAALDGLSFAPNLNFNGAASLQITTDDLANTGSGGALSDTDTVAIGVSAVNDAPVNNVPGPQSVNEDTTLVFSAANGNRISLSDVDAAAGVIQVSLTAASGTLTLSGTSGLTFLTGDGQADSNILFTATLTDANAALNGLVFNPTSNLSGSALVSISVSDQGNTGAGGALSDNATIPITINAINDRPVNNIPAPQSITEDSVLVFSSGNGNLISITDIDAGAAAIEISLTADDVVLTLAQLN